MRERVLAEIPQTSVTISTFHAFGLSLLKEHFAEFSRKGDFYIIDEGEKEEISRYKQGIGGPSGPQNRGAKAPPVLREYVEELQKCNAFDLDDLICLPVELFKENLKILKKYQDRFQWILVDEYQDINAKQYELIRLLAGEKPNLFVIGDPDQAIYGFRGSDIRFIDKLKEDYPNVKEIRLKKSFRCPGNVLKIAGQVLNRGDSLQGIEDDIKITVQQCDTDKSEADWIATQIEKMIGGVRSFSMDSGISDGAEHSGIESFGDFAVLCRTTAMFDAMETAFNHHGIVYQVIGQEPFYKKEPIAGIIQNFKRIYYADVGAYSNTPLQQKMIENSQSMLKDNIPIISVLGYLMQDLEISDQDKRRLELFASRFGSNYAGFFQAMTMHSEADDFDPKAESVSLMTMHASKGLEFKAVFILGCEEGMLPFDLFGKKEGSELKEEERLFYVAATRTKQSLFLTHANKRNFKGRILQQERSRFINRIEKDFLQFQSRETKKVPASEYDQLSLF